MPYYIYWEAQDIPQFGSAQIVNVYLYLEIVFSLTKHIYFSRMKKAAAQPHPTSISWQQMLRSAQPQKRVATKRQPANGEKKKVEGKHYF